MKKDFYLVDGRKLSGFAESFYVFPVRLLKSGWVVYGLSGWRGSLGEFIDALCVAPHRQSKMRMILNGEKVSCFDDTDMPTKDFEILLRTVFPGVCAVLRKE